MKMKQGQTQNRRGFTLIEILVTISIIAILAGLILAGVMAVWNKAPETQAHSEMTTFETALAAARADLGNVDYLPSFLRLREDNNYTSANPVIQQQYNQTKAALHRAFGRNINLSPLPGNQFIDWNGDGARSNVDIVLEGQHCLVFWTGGIPQRGTTIKMSGFSADPQYPAQHYVNGTPAAVASQVRKGPYFQSFDSSRLVQLANDHFPVYLDPYSVKNQVGPGGLQMFQPYAYFSSGSKGNDYTTTDCSSLGVQPYWTSLAASGGVQFVNPKGFQIISAGQDHQWSSGPASQTFFQLPRPVTDHGGDNVANFQAGRLSTTP